MFRYSVLTTIGAVRHFVVSGKPVFGADGTFLGYRGTANNETPLVEALQRAEQAETLLRDAMDSLSEGFVIFDQDDRLVLCNEAYRRMYPASARLMVPGVKFETLVRNTLISGHYPDAEGREEEWVQNFLRVHNEAVDELETQQQEGRWILVSERRMRNGGLAGLRIDITDLKRIQGALQRQRAAAARLCRDGIRLVLGAGRRLPLHRGFRKAAVRPRCTERPYLGKPRWEMFPGGATPEQWEAHKADIAAQRPIPRFPLSARRQPAGARTTSASTACRCTMPPARSPGIVASAATSRSKSKPSRNWNRPRNGPNKPRRCCATPWTASPKGS